MKSSRILLVPALMLLMASCQKEDGPEISGHPSQDGMTVLSLSLPDGGVTRTYLGERAEDTYPLLWAEGDRVSLNGTFSSPVSPEHAGQRKCAFSFRGSITSPFNVLYPATEFSDKVVFPATQTYSPGSFDPAAMPMYASCGTYSDASMRHLGTLLGFPFIAPEGTDFSLKHLVVMSIDGKVLSGTFTLAKDEKEGFTGGFASAEGVSTATLEFPQDGLRLGGIPVTAWISLPAGEYAKGFTALVVDSEDKAMMLNFMTGEDSPDLLSPGTAVIFPEVTFNPGEGIFIIDGPEDLIRLAAEPTAHPEVLMVRNIDMSEVQDWTPVESFSGLFNGAGHTVAGLDKSLFGTLHGEVRNLVVDADITSSDAVASALVNEVSADGKVVSCTVTGSISLTGNNSGNVYIGGIAAVNHGEIISSTSDVRLSIPAGTVCGPVYMGGIAGYSDGVLEKLVGSSAIECAGTVGASHGGVMAGFVRATEKVQLKEMETSERASISLACQTGDGPLLKFGGLFGYVEAPEISIEACVNRTRIDVTIPEGVSNSRLYMGGLIGQVFNESGDREARFDSCINHGNMTFTNSGNIGDNNVTNRRFCVGGIVGKSQILNRTVFEDCVNNGDIHLNSVTPTAKAQVAYVAGLCGDVISSDIHDLRCINNGDISFTGFTVRSVIAGHIALIRPTSTNKTTLTVIGKGGEPVNTGSLAYYDKELCQNVPMAGGVIGSIRADKGVVEFSIRDCTNSGVIDRKAQETSIFNGTENKGSEASAGGIVGNIGYMTVNANYTKVTGTIENCTNTAQITINAFTREDATFHDYHVERSATSAFLGGILGFSHAQNGLVTVKDCSNSGYMRLTAGTAGGIVGRIQSNTIVTGTKSSAGVTYTTNSGRVGEFGLELPPAYLSTGYCYTGGIVGALVYSSADNVSKIEYCYNSGAVAGSHVKYENSGEGTWLPTAGGIIGQYDFGRTYAAVRWCKNSGHVRCYRSSAVKSSWAHNGLISGSAMCNRVMDESVAELKVALVRDCAVGGQCTRASGWIIPTVAGGEYPFYDYIYCYYKLSEDYPATTEDGKGYAEGCVFWDGVSTLSWEE